MAKYLSPDDLREHTGEASNIYQATIAIIAIFDGFIFMSLLELLKAASPLNGWEMAEIWLLTMALLAFTYAMLCFHAVGYRIINHFGFFFPRSQFIIYGRYLMNIAMLLMFSGLGALLCGKGQAPLTILAGIVELGAVGMVIFTNVGKRLNQANIIDVDRSMSPHTELVEGANGPQDGSNIEQPVSPVSGSQTTAGNQISAQDKINILFKEYDTLRAEIIARSSSTDRILAAGTTILAAFVAWIVTSQWARMQWMWLVALLFCLLLVFAYLLLIIRRITRRCGYRLLELEERINNLAGQRSNPLLEWETRWGANSIGLFREFPKDRRRP